MDLDHKFLGDSAYAKLLSRSGVCQKILSVTFDGIVIHDGQKVVSCNRRFADKFLYGTDDIIGVSVSSLINGNANRLEPGSDHRQADGSYMAVGVRRDSSRFPVEVSDCAASLQGQPVRVAAIRDTSPLIAAQDQIKRSQEYTHMALNAAGASTWYLDFATDVMTWSSEIYQLVGKQEPTEELTIAAMLEYVHPDDRSLLGRLTNPDFTHNNDIDFEFRVSPDDNGYCWHNIIGRRIRDADDNPIGMYGIQVDVTERKRAVDAQQMAQQRESDSLRKTILAVVRTVEARDPYTAGHERRVARLSVEIAKSLGLDGKQIEGLSMAAEIHDLGKLKIPMDLLSKPARLTPIELELVKTHTTVGAELIDGIEFERPIARIVRQHHERLDGSGYPDGLVGTDILCEARIISVADVVEAIASHRPYRAAMGVDAALVELLQERGRLYDPEVVDACVGLFKDAKYELGA